MVPADRSAEPVMVGPYRLIQRLGEGGMGVVHLALDPDGKAVAIKVLRPHIASDPDARLRLEREVATLRRVHHPQIAAVIDADVDGDVPYLVTAFVPGKPLDAHVKEHGALPRGHVARIGAVLADALRSLHAAGIVHRDVKPANVMLLDGDPVLIDFGIAHVADESRITHTGLVMGTPGYLSPEIIGGEQVSPATDWWGWGATLAYAATARPPFGTGPIEVVLDRVRRGASDLDGIDAGLRATLTQALSVDPAQRPAPEILVAGLAATAPARSAVTSVIDLDSAATPSVAAAPVGSPLARPGDRTIPRTPPAAAPPAVSPGWSNAPASSGGASSGAASFGGTFSGRSGSEDVTMHVPPLAADDADAATRRSTARTDPVPPPPDWRGGQSGDRTEVLTAESGDGGDRTEVLPPARGYGNPTEAVPPVNGFGDRSRVPASAPPPPPPPPPRPAYAGQPAPSYPSSSLYPTYPTYPDHPPSYPPHQPPDDRWAAGTPVGDDTSDRGQAGGESLTWGDTSDRGQAGGESLTWGDRMAQPIDPSTGGRGVLAAVLVALCLIAAVAPQSAVIIVWLLLAVMRVIDKANTSLLLRRQQFGERNGDAVRVGLGVPWHLAMSLISSFFLLILPVLIGISVVFISAAALAGNPDQAIPSGPGSLAAGLAALLLTSWAGPGGGAVRRGSRLLVRKVVTTRRAQLATWTVIALIGLAAVMVTTQQAAPDWGTWSGTWLVRQLSR